MSLTQERLKELLRYDPDTGIFIWRVTRRVKIGDVAGTIRDGYVRIRVCRVLYLAHRLAWFYMTGKWPSLEIDHKDGNPANNRWDNLREVTRSINGQNQRKANRDSKIGLLGVSKNGNSFQAQIKLNGKARYLGRYPTPELAYASYLKAKRELHPGNTLDIQQLQQTEEENSA